MKSYCVKQKKETECVEPSGYMTAKNGRAMLWCTCAECGIKKKRFVSKQTGGEMTLSDLGSHLAFVPKKLFQMGRFATSEMMRNPKLQKKAVTFALDKSKPYLKKTASKMFDDLSTVIRSKKIILPIEKI